VPALIIASVNLQTAIPPAQPVKDGWSQFVLCPGPRLNRYRKISFIRPEIECAAEQPRIFLPLIAQPIASAASFRFAPLHRRNFAAQERTPLALAVFARCLRPAMADATRAALDRNVAAWASCSRSRTTDRSGKPPSLKGGSCCRKVCFLPN
jgi:hypothetical protein